LFIKEEGSDIAKRFLEYEAIESYYEATEYQKHCKDLGETPLTKEELAALEKRRNDLCKRYGDDFTGYYGWAASVLSKRQRNFAAIEKKVDLDMLRPFYKMACINVHSGPKGITFKIGLMDNSTKSEVHLAGPSNFGLTDPGHSMAVSLSQITTVLLTTKPTVERLVIITAIQKLVDEIGEAFLEVQHDIEKEESEENRYEDLSFE